MRGHAHITWRYTCALARRMSKESANKRAKDGANGNDRLRNQIGEFVYKTLVVIIIIIYNNNEHIYIALDQ